MEAITIIGAGSVARRGDRDAFVGRDAGAGELADEPTVSDLVVDNDGITEAARLANAAEAGKKSLDIERAEKGSAGRDQ